MYFGSRKHYPSFSFWPTGPQNLFADLTFAGHAPTWTSAISLPSLSNASSPVATVGGLTMVSALFCTGHRQ